MGIAARGRWTGYGKGCCTWGCGGCATGDGERSGAGGEAAAVGAIGEAGPAVCKGTVDGCALVMMTGIAAGTSLGVCAVSVCMTGDSDLAAVVVTACRAGAIASGATENGAWPAGRVGILGSDRTGTTWGVLDTVGSVFAGIEIAGAGEMEAGWTD